AEAEEEEEEEDDLEFDEENGEVKEKPEPSPAPEARTLPEVYAGELMVDMLRLALALDYFEFANEEAVAWRIDKENKRLIPSISAGKMGLGLPSYQAFHWKKSDFDQSAPKAINYIAGRDGRIYESRENEHLQVMVATRIVPALEDV